MSVAEIELEGRALWEHAMLERGFSFQPINDVEGQYTKGDYVLFPRRTGKAKNAEIKTEEENPNGNLFIEKWSDKRPERERPGWLYNLTECNLLFYIFLKLKIMYMLDFQALRTFDFSKYDEVPQTKQVQNNFRLIFTNQEREFWPHPGLPHPEETSIVDWWRDVHEQAMALTGELAMAAGV